MKKSSIKSSSRIIYLSVGAMILGVLFIDIYGIIIKFLGDAYSTNQVVLFRNLFAIIPLLLLIFYTNENLKIFRKITKKFIILCFIRGQCFLFMNVFYFIAINNMDFATASTLTFSATFFIVILSILFLNDKVGIYRWSAVFIGFIGVALIMKPTSEVFSYYSIYPVMVGLLYSIAIIILKFIPEHNSTAKIQFYSLISSIIGAVVLLAITLDTKFGGWDYSNNGIEERMPYYSSNTNSGILTTSISPVSTWWGTIIAGQSGWVTAPWGSGISSPSFIWYWVR